MSVIMIDHLDGYRYILTESFLTDPKINIITYKIKFIKS